MTLASIFGKGVKESVAIYVLGDAPSREDIEKIWQAAKKAHADINIKDAMQDADALRAATEKGPRRTHLEALSAKIARAILINELRARVDLPNKRTLKWVSAHITAHSRNTYQIVAVWRTAAGLGTDHDKTIFDHTVESALIGITINPAPKANPDEIVTTGTEDTMTDPTIITADIMKQTELNATNLPKRLRTEEGLRIYLDAVVQAVDLLGHSINEDDAFIWATSAAGLMLLDGHYNPTDQRFFAHAQKAVAELSGSAVESGQIEIDGHQVSMFAPNANETQRISVFSKTFEELQKIAGKDVAVFLQSFAHTGRRLSDRYDEHKGDRAKMYPMVRSEYDGHVISVASGGGGGGIANVDLPPLNDPHGYNDEIEPENVKAVSTIYVSYQLEFGLKATARILDLFVAGLLPISAADGNARELDTLYWDQDDLLDEASRRSVYSRVLGAPGGELGFDMQPNSEFNTLLMRVVSAVSEFEREQSVLTHFDNAARGQRFQSTSGEFVRKAVRDFAANVSLRGWAGTAFAAERMAKQVHRVMRILNLPSVRNAFGVTTPWQVIERVSQREFGITVNTVLHRTLAVETQRIMGIIADNHTIWSSGSGLKPLFSTTEANEGDLSLETTRELMIACQHFRAVTGVGDALLDEYSEPVETTAQPSLPDFGGTGGMSIPGIDMGGVDQLRSMMSSGQAPSLEQLKTMLPGF